MEDLHDAVEILSEAAEHAEGAAFAARRHARRSKILVSVLVVVATGLISVAGYGAAVADMHAIGAERDQQGAALDAQDANSARQAVDQVVQAEYAEASDSLARAAATARLLPAVAWSPGLAASLSDDKAERVDDARAEIRLGRSTETPHSSQARRVSTYYRATETATVKGVAAYQWRRKQIGYIGAAALGAISLFLLGLVLTITHPRIRLGLLAVGAAISLAAFAWIIGTTSSGIATISSPTLAAYASGMTHEWAGAPKLAERRLGQVIRRRPQTADAWYALAEIEGSEPEGFPTRQRLLRACADYRQALKAGYVDRSTALNDLATDELLVGDVAAASRDIAKAISETGVSNRVTLATAQVTKAEVLLQQGKSEAADTMLATAVTTLQRSQWADLQTVSDWFDSLRDDWLYVAHVEGRTTGLDRFYGKALYDDEPRLFGVSASTAVPGGPAIANLRLSYDERVPSGTASLLQVQFDHHRFVGDNRFSMHTYDLAGDRASLVFGASVLNNPAGWTWGSGDGHWNRSWPLVMKTGHRYLVEVFWSNHLLGSACVAVDGNGSLSDAGRCDPFPSAS